MAEQKQSDAEVICEHMQPRSDAGQSWPSMTWWQWEGQWIPIALTLDVLRDVEQKLIDMNGDYCADIRGQYEMCPDLIWHLTAADKTKVLASIIRGIKP